MLQQLEENLNSALRGNDIPFKGIKCYSRWIFIDTGDMIEAARAASRVFGVSTASTVATMPAASIDDASTTQEQYIEVIDEEAHVVDKAIEGVGGLPSGSEGKVVCTISGGLDSPVAAFKAMKRGCVPIFVHFDNVPYGDESTRDLAIRQAKSLAEYIHGHEVKMYVVPHGEDLTEILRHAPRKMTCIFCRRNMYRLAEKVALRENADAIITGEIIGEQASQTTRNLLAEENAVCDITIIRPCIGDDKVEIEKLAMKIGTYKFTHEAVSCCSLPPKYPTIHARLGEIRPAEEKMNMEILDAELADAEVIVLKRG